MIRNIEGLIGNTPLVPIRRLNPKDGRVKLYAKLEGQNPGGSVKDRPAYNMIRSALERGDIGMDTHLIEATSGNTGIALAMMGSILGLKITLVMPDTATEERVKTMRAYGAKVILTPGDQGGIEYSRAFAEQKVKEEGYYMLDQFANEDNWKAHFKTTGPEIWEDTHGAVTHFVSAMGTTGTITGISRFLKSQNHQIQIIGAQPTEGSRIPGIRRWSPGFLPKIYDPEAVDQFFDIAQEEAEMMSRNLAKEEGIFCGISSGGAMAAATKLIREIDEGTVVFIVCDRGDRYLSAM